jgi:hypothetical protein
MKALDMQHCGSHYKKLAIQPTEYWKANHLGGDEAAAIKYVSRWRDKGGLDDLYKAQHHLQFVWEDLEYRVRVADIARLTKAGAGYRDIITPDDYIEANRLPVEEGRVVRYLTVWNHTGASHNLRSAIASMAELIAKAEDELAEAAKK